MNEDLSDLIERLTEALAQAPDLDVTYSGDTQEVTVTADSIARNIAPVVSGMMNSNTPTTPPSPGGPARKRRKVSIVPQLREAYTAGARDSHKLNGLWDKGFDEWIESKRNAQKKESDDD